MTLRARSRSAGFTLTELMIGVAILGIIVTMGMPSFKQMLRSAEIRSVTESIAVGLQRARAEAVARNTKVRFVLSASTANSSDTAWNVLDIANTTLDTRAATDGSSPNTTLTSTPALATTITFNQLGQVVANADTSATLTQVDVTATGSNRNLRVVVGLGGSAKVCDPNLATGSSPRAC